MHLFRFRPLSKWASAQGKQSPAITPRDSSGRPALEKRRRGWERSPSCTTVQGLSAAIQSGTAAVKPRAAAFELKSQSTYQRSRDSPRSLCLRASVLAPSRQPTPQTSRAESPSGLRLGLATWISSRLIPTSDTIMHVRNKGFCYPVQKSSLLTRVHKCTIWLLSLYREGLFQESILKPTRDKSKATLLLPFLRQAILLPTMTFPPEVRITHWLLT